MGRLNMAIRNAMYELECSTSVIAESAKVSRSIIHDAMHDRARLRQRTARSIVLAVRAELDGQIARKEREIKHLREIKTELHDAYNDEYEVESHGR